MGLRIMNPIGESFTFIHIDDESFEIRLILEQQPVVGVLDIDPAFEYHKIVSI